MNISWNLLVMYLKHLQVWCSEVSVMLITEGGTQRPLFDFRWVPGSYPVHGTLGRACPGGGPMVNIGFCQNAYIFRRESNITSFVCSVELAPPDHGRQGRTLGAWPDVHPLIIYCSGSWVIVLSCKRILYVRVRCREIHMYMWLCCCFAFENK